MVEIIEIEQFLEMKDRFTPLDIRSPVEFSHSHIPESINIPLFSDEERASIGWTFKHKGQKEAILLGESFAMPKIPIYLKHAEGYSKNRTVLILCARGGMRSGKFSEFLSENGFHVYKLNLGYKNYRRHVLGSFLKPLNLIVLAGKTGCGKTEILEKLLKMEEQVLDLEGLASHRGSAFGTIGYGPQPSTEYFENCLFEKIRKFQPEKRIWVEDESLNIGKIFLPAGFYDQMKVSPQVLVEMDRESRISRLCEDYGQSGISPLKMGFEKIRKRLGMERYTQAVQALDADNLPEATAIVLQYYDKCYDYSLASKKRRTLFCIHSESGDTDAAASRIIHKMGRNP